MAGIVLLIFVLITMFMGYQMYASTSKIYRRTQQSTAALNQIDGNLLTINRDVLMLINESGNASALMKETEFLYEEIKDSMEQYEEVFENAKESDKAERKRYAQTKNFINAYHEKIEQLLVIDPSTGKLIRANEAKDLYTQEIHPLQTTASEMCAATRDLRIKNVTSEMRRAARILIYFEGTMLLILVLSEVAIIIAAGVAKRRAADLAKREAQVAAFDSKLQHSRQKINDITNMNILTGMKNRYALESEITDRLETEEFNCAVFDLDNFRGINDYYGYEFGDEYLAQVAERVREEFGDQAEIYNISGNEFCFIFNNDISYQQATRIAQNVLATMGGVYTVLNIGVQLTASGSVYHYAAGDALNVSSLLMKLDNVMRNVKRNGGNAFAEVVNI